MGKISLKTLLGGLLGLALGFYLIFKPVSNQKQEKYQDLNKQHEKISQEIERKTKEMAPFLKQLDWPQIKQKGQELVAQAEKLVQLEEELINLNLKKENPKLQKRKEFEEAMIAAFKKLIICADLKQAKQEEEFKKCDEESKPLFDRFDQLTKEYQEKFK